MAFINRNDLQFSDKLYLQYSKYFQAASSKELWLGIFGGGTGNIAVGSKSAARDGTNRNKKAVKGGKSGATLTGRPRTQVNSIKWLYLRID